MRRAFLILLLGLTVLATGSPRARAFSMIGEIPAWFTDQTGQIPNVDVYGPVNLGEEYRWTVPNLIYAFDESFVNYFGQKGVDEVEKAIAILNALPSMDSVDLSQFPLHSQRVNFRARDLSMIDVKSYVLKSLMEQLGLGTPGRHVFNLRARAPESDPPITNYVVVLRNFDPETWAPTPYINGQLWTYTDIFDNQDSPTVKATTITAPVDPLVLAEPVASLIPGPFTFSVFGFGSYVTGLTRDDVGGLRYIYRTTNRNTETLPPDAFGVAGFAGGGSGEGGWVPIPAPSTNQVDQGGGGAVVTTNGVFYPQAIRGGVGKVTFVRHPVFYQPNGFGATNRFTESVTAVITNGVQRTVSQRVTRVLTAPDFLFSAADLVQPDATVVRSDRTEVATSNDGINGSPGQGNTLDGPGQFTGPTVITLNKAGPLYVNTAPFFLGQPSSFEFFIWGSFDGSTNEPAVYPTGSSIRDIERQVFGGR